LNEQIADITAKLNGVIFRKAELEKNFEKVYLKIFEKMVEIEEFDNFLIVFGDLGG